MITKCMVIIELLITMACIITLLITNNKTWLFPIATNGLAFLVWLNLYLSTSNEEQI